MNELELRMYFFVPYNISPIQQAIQSGHAALEYAQRFNDSQLFQDFMNKYKTWIILNGGTTNNGFEGQEKGTLQEIYSSIIVFNVDAKLDDKIDVEKFYEPDLNGALTAVCFICDERVFNRLDYPDKESFLIDVVGDYDNIDDIEEHEENWFKMIGGEKNVFLRELLKGKKLA